MSDDKQVRDKGMRRKSIREGEVWWWSWTIRAVGETWSEGKEWRSAEYKEERERCGGED